MKDFIKKLSDANVCKLADVLNDCYAEFVEAGGVATFELNQLAALVNVENDLRCKKKEG